MLTPDPHDMEEVAIQEDSEVAPAPLRSAEEQRRMPVGRPFPPGVSGNPSGRPRGFSGLARERTLDGRLLIDYAVELVKGTPVDMEMIWPAKEEGGQPTVVRYKITPNPKVRLEAAQWLADRGWGRPLQAVEVTPGRAFLVQHRRYAPGQDPFAQAEDAEVSLEPGQRTLPTGQ